MPKREAGAVAAGSPGGIGGGEPMLARGAKGNAVRWLQRALSAAGYLLVVDGVFGSATQAAVRQFQCDHGLVMDGVVGRQTWAAFAGTPGQGAPGAEGPPEQRGGIAGGVLAVALSELAAGAREVGGQNRGPWVRKYMDGREGLPWCAGFATWCYRQACARLGVTPGLRERFSSSRLVAEAKKKGLLITRSAAVSGRDCVAIRPGTAGQGEQGREPRAKGQGEGKRLSPGCFFVLRGGATGYRHTGIVRSVGDGYITTVEGNTRLPREPGPDHVVSRWRGTAKLVFIVPGVVE